MLSMNARDVRYGSGTDISRPDFYVRYTPDNRHRSPFLFRKGLLLGFGHEMRVWEFADFIARRIVYVGRGAI